MKSKTAVALFIAGIFMFLLSISYRVIYKSPVSLFADTFTVDGQTYTTDLYSKAIHFCSVLYFISLVTAILLLSLVVYRWNNLDFYNRNIIKQLDFLGTIFLLVGGLTIFVHLGLGRTIGSSTSVTNIWGYHLHLRDALFICAIGCFFFLITAVLTTGKRLKDENDLTI